MQLSKYCIKSYIASTGQTVDELQNFAVSQDGYVAVGADFT